jgi:hypothetical protein
MNKTDRQRIRDLEVQLQLVQQELARVAARPATPMQVRDGRWLAVLNGSLSQGGTATAEILHWSIADAEWQRSGDTVTVQESWLNTGDAAIPTDTILEVVFQGNVWRPGAIACQANDWLGA